MKFFLIMIFFSSLLLSKEYEILRCDVTSIDGIKYAVVADNDENYVRSHYFILDNGDKTKPIGGNIREYCEDMKKHGFIESLKDIQAWRHRYTFNYKGKKYHLHGDRHKGGFKWVLDELGNYSDDGNNFIKCIPNK